MSIEVNETITEDFLLELGFSWGKKSTNLTLGRFGIWWQTQSRTVFILSMPIYGIKTKSQLLFLILLLDGEKNFTISMNEASEDERNPCQKQSS